MQERCETITIKGQDGSPLRINATDFKAGEHELYDGPEGGIEKPAVPDPASNPVNGSPTATGPGANPPAAAPPVGAPAPKR